MVSDTVSVLCGKCKVAVDGPTNPKSKDIFTCPKCGRSDNFKNVMASVEKHTLDLMSNHMSDALNGSTRGNKLVKFTGKRIPNRSYPFVSDLKL